jgi:uncharacterized membrane protein
MIALLKSLHIVALIFWCGGLLVLPGLFGQRGISGGREETLELQRFARRVFIGVTSPAAFVAVIAGTILLFMREVFTTWMMLKLFAVGLLVMIHVRAGFLILNLFKPHGRYAPWRRWAITAATLAVIGIILVLVLSKPFIDFSSLPLWMREPGGLQSLSEIIRPMP